MEDGKKRGEEGGRMERADRVEGGEKGGEDREKRGGGGGWV